MTVGSGTICGASVSHERATVDDLGATGVQSQRDAAADLLESPGVDEAFVLRTCNRVEGYVVAADETTGRQALDRVVGDAPEDAVAKLGHEASLRHLLRVAAGLESVVVGEDQILGQVRDAFEDARAVGAVGPLLEDAVTKAIRVGERARTETAINDGVLSLASAAVTMASEETHLEGPTGLVVGAGEMGTLAAKALSRVVDRLLVANRTVPQAAHVVANVDVAGSAVGLEDLSSAFAAADVVVTATGASTPIVDETDVAGAGETFVVDLGQPRDLSSAAAAHPAVTFRDLDALESLTDETRRQRQAAVGAVEEIVDEELGRLKSQYKRNRADQVLSAMYESAEGVKTREVETALSKLDLDEDSQAVVEAMADAIVSSLLAPPTKSLRDAAEEDDWETIRTALELFDPEFGPDAGDRVGAGPAAIPEDLHEEFQTAVFDDAKDD
ncbi:MAG: glutamyl-tRNA reductase [Haloarculaceae archaeon]